MKKFKNIGMKAIFLTFAISMIVVFSTIFNVPEAEKQFDDVVPQAAFSVETLSTSYNDLFNFRVGTIYKATNGVSFNAGAKVYDPYGQSDENRYGRRYSVLYIPKGKTVYAYGTEGCAGIEVTGNRALIVVGGGTLEAKGGNAGRGYGGSNGTSGVASGTPVNGRGGNGGNGGRGAGAGIGGNGGYGGGGGTGASGGSSGYNGGRGGSGNNGDDMGYLYVLGSITIEASGGGYDYYPVYGGSAGYTDQYGFILMGGGGGGGAGAFGKFDADAIGGGAGGGGGGGGGAAGPGSSSTGGFYYDMNGYGGSGGSGGIDGPNGKSGSWTYLGGSQPYGGAGGAAGKKGGSGKLYAQNGTSIASRSSDYSTTGRMTELQYYITFSPGANCATNGDTGQTVYFFQSMTKINVPTKTGYTFMGYYTAENGGGTQYFDENGYALTNRKNDTNKEFGDRYDQFSNITLYAKWEVNKYYVSFNAGSGATGTMNTQTLSYKNDDESGDALTANAFEKTGHYFKGWSKSSSATTVNYTDKQVVKNLSTSKGAIVSLYAVWEKETYNITFYGNGGKVNSVSEDTHQVKYDESVTVVVDRPGYNFNYFTKEKSPTTDSTKYPLSGNQFKVVDFGENGAIVPMYAQWTAKQYSITYDAGGKTLTEGSLPSSVRLNYDDTGTTYKIPSNVIKAKGYEFNGWENEANGKIYQPGQQVAIKDLFNISTQSGVYNISNITLTAEWIPITYKVKFDPNTIDIKNEKLFTTPTVSPSIADSSFSNLTPSNEIYTLTYGKSYLISSTFVCNGYNLVGLRTNADATGPLCSWLISNLTDVKDQEITFYAQWEPTWSKFAHKESAKPVQQGSTYLIQSAENLGWLMGTISFGSTELKNSINSTITFKQTRNIYLTDYPWNPDGIFSSRYDGNGCYIYDLHNETEDNKNIIIKEYVGLFAQTSGASLQKITIMSGNLVGEENCYVGSIVGYASNTLIKNCINYASVYGKGSAMGFVGGIVGYKTDSDSSNASATMSSCINYGKVVLDYTSDAFVGGIVGYIENGVVKSCYVKSTIIANAGFSGGIAGLAGNVTIEQCAYIGNIIQTEYVFSNGICAWADGASAKDCLVRTSTSGLDLFPNIDNNGMYSTNCIGYLNNGSPQTTAGMDYTNWTTINGQYFPKGLTWIA